MKSILLTLLLTAVSRVGFAQFGIAYHQTNIPFVAVNYEFIDRIRPEVRLSTDTFFEDLSVEGVVTFDILNKEDYEFYAGFGVRTNEFAGVVIPVGVHVYPLQTKKFGFHIELAPIIDEYEILRGSWGIRYRFLQ